jgi:16S rRNA (uracil1498-N3)-methyltransferase
MHLFYDPSIAGHSHFLDQQESAHCVRVLRLKENDIIYLTDGAGYLHKSKIISANPKKCELQIIETLKEYNKSPYYLHIAIAPTKNIDRFEWFLEKSTEIGINEITPIICDRSERRIIKHERLIKVISSAMKQSLKAYLPNLNEQINLRDFLKKADEGLNFVANCEEDSTNHLYKNCQPGGKTTILIGPEGDFSEEEISTALQMGYKNISLGNARLRTETAGIVACHTVSVFNQIER